MARCFGSRTRDIENACVRGEAKIFGGKCTQCNKVVITCHLSHNREGRWGTTDDFATSFLYFSLFSTALWDLANSRPVHSLMLSSHHFFRLPSLLPPFNVPCKMILAGPDEWETCPYHFSLHPYPFSMSGFKMCHKQNVLYSC